jgi:hypothetical protein
LDIAKPLKIIRQQPLYQCEYAHDYRYFEKVSLTREIEFGFAIAKSTNVVVNQVLKQVDE